MRGEKILPGSTRSIPRSAIVTPNMLAGESRLLIRNPILKKALIAAALTSFVLLPGCGRKGLPVPLDSEVAAKADAAKELPATQIDPTANSQKTLPKGRDDNSLKAGAPKGQTPFDFLL